MEKRGNCEGTISKRKDGRWEGKLSTGFDFKTSKSIRQTFYGESQKEVRDKMEVVKAQITTGTFVNTNKITVGDWMDNWLNTYSKPSVRIATWESYETMVRVHINPSIGQIHLQELLPTHLQKLYNDKLETGRIRDGSQLSPITVGYIHTVIQMALKQAQQEQIVFRNVAEFVKKPKQVKHCEKIVVLLFDLKHFHVLGRLSSNCRQMVFKCHAKQKCTRRILNRCT